MEDIMTMSENLISRSVLQSGWPYNQMMGLCSRWRENSPLINGLAYEAICSCLQFRADNLATVMRVETVIASDGYYYCADVIMFYSRG